MYKPYMDDGRLGSDADWIIFNMQPVQERPIYRKYSEKKKSLICV